jgi:hypothetical protein
MPVAIKALAQLAPCAPNVVHAVRRRRSRCGTVFSVQCSGPPLSPRPFKGTDTGAPACARGENTQMDVFVRLFRR